MSNEPHQPYNPILDSLTASASVDYAASDLIMEQATALTAEGKDAEAAAAIEASLAELLAGTRKDIEALGPLAPDIMARAERFADGLESLLEDLKRFPAPKGKNNEEGDVAQ